MEVALLGSDSKDTVKVTHSNYFEDPLESLNKFLARLARQARPGDQTAVGG